MTNCRCSRCEDPNAETEHYYLWWASDVNGWFWLCDACADFYAPFINQ